MSSRQEVAIKQRNDQTRNRATHDSKQMKKPTFIGRTIMTEFGKFN